MKITQIISEKGGLGESKAREVWDAFEKFGSYGFNKSHAVAYTAISYQSMYLKVHHPAAFFAAALTIQDDEKHRAVVKDALAHGVVVMPPDINISTERIEIRKLSDGRTALYAPFSAVKGCSEKGCFAIMRARALVGGRFESMKEFKQVVEARQCNARVQSALEEVGAFASIEPGSEPALAESRRKAQAELMGSLIIDAVKVHREFEMNHKRQAEVSMLMEELRKEVGIGEDLVTPHIGVSPKIMIILDSANGNDVKTGIFMENGYDDFKAKMLVMGDLRMSEVYVTGVVKQDKRLPLSRDAETTYIDYLKKELELVKPTYVLTCGRLAASIFNDKTKATDLVGRKEYVPATDTTVFYGFNPGILHFRPEEGEKLELIMEDIKEVLS
ncbi:TPA: uracil-DNA glycosylase [Klebsiella variicola]